MSLPEAIKSKFNELSLIQKIAAIALLPLTILVILFKAKSWIGDLLENRARDKVDEKDKELQDKIDSTGREIAKQEGKIEQLEGDKKEAVDKAETDDSVSFHNSRKP